MFKRITLCAALLAATIAAPVQAQTRPSAEAPRAARFVVDRDLSAPDMARLTFSGDAYVNEMG